MKKYINKTTGIILIAILMAGCGQKDEVLMTGKTMGTTYHIRVVTGFFENAEGLKKKIDERLREINQSMSTYIKESEISKFNAISSTDEKFYISDDFLKVMIVAKNLHDLTNHAWDGTIKPLINLWGFGNSEIRNDVPDAEEIHTILENIGFDHIKISEERYLKKGKASISLDLASIAKGYGVDQIADLIEKKGFKNFLVEIGGEVYASGFRKDGGQWKVGINTPRKDAAYDEIYNVVTLHDKAFATSGDYRNFFEADGKRYSHVLDPTTGYPVTNRVVSVSVVADNCTFADGLATALMVMGHEKGLKLVSTLDNTECLIVLEEKDGSLTDYFSKGFKLEN
ncbi:FAD:protein FMN transferase [Desulfonema magnum]|uniref:FAD:protein FMN transferase n=1 Tax=Desulfonema magnum TaxID=45655 RepID=A0A975BQ18_9BACT|nr:FAD:protein FMN transferase [Desulfonema magnum]QTA89764.1 FAD:protein FMN transferase [Desulfonema magnum]